MFQMLQCIMLEEIGFEQRESAWVSIVLQSLRWQTGSLWKPQNLHWCRQNFSRRWQRMPQVTKEFKKIFDYQIERDFSFFQRCGGAVYEAEKVTIKDDPYHKKCLSCNKCGRQLDSLSLSIAPDNNVYCKVSWKNLQI